MFSHLKSVALAFIALSGAALAGGTTHVVTTSGFSFSPADITIEVGDTVMWTNLQIGFHNVAETDFPPSTSSTNNGGFFSGPPGTQATFLHTFNVAGQFAYVCETHTLSGMFGTVTVQPAAIGTPVCVGTGNCPCGNDDPGAGCQNSSGVGGLLSATGSTSTAADDLVLNGTQLPPNNNGLCYMGDTEVDNPFFDGRQCALGATFRFLTSIQNSGAGGTMSFTGMVADSGGLIQPATSWIFHFWHRDVSPIGPCGTGANLTHALSVTFTP